MKIAESKVNAMPGKGMPKLNLNSLKSPAAPKAAGPAMFAPKAKAAVPLSPAPRPTPKAPAPARLAPVSRAMQDDYSSLKEVAATVTRLKHSAQMELDQIRRMRADAVKYQQETAIKARSEAHQLVLHARLETQREIEEIVRQASDEIQKVLADIRVIRITAQEELAAQRKFTDAAKLNIMSANFKEEMARAMRKKKQLVP
jgi:hypothetical protein